MAKTLTARAPFRSGAALLITMVFVILILSFAAVFYDRASRSLARSESRNAFASANSLLFSFGKSALDELTTAIRKAADGLCSGDREPRECREGILIDGYDALYKLPIFFDAGGFHITIACSPLGLKADINSLKIESGVDETNRDQSVFRRRDAVERYLRERRKLYSAWQFFELLDFVFDPNGVKNGYLKNDTRLNVSNPFLERGRISSSRALRMIAGDYAARAHDNAALDIDWDELFDYESPGGRIDFNNMSQESCEMIFSDMPAACDRGGEGGDRIRMAREDIVSRFRGAETLINDFNLSFGFNPNLSCRVKYQNEKIALGFNFYYSSESGRVFGLKIDPF